MPSVRSLATSPSSFSRLKPRRNCRESIPWVSSQREVYCHAHCQPSLYAAQSMQPPVSNLVRLLAKPSSSFSACRSSPTGADTLVICWPDLRQHIQCGGSETPCAYTEPRQVMSVPRRAP